MFKDLKASKGDRVIRKAFILVLLILSVVLTACPSNPPRDFTLSLNPTSLTVQQGASGQTTLTVTPQNGFTGTVNLSLVDGSGNPVPGITLAPTSVNVAGSSPVSQNLTVSVAASVAPNTYILQLRATSGSLTKAANLSLTVTPPPDFTLSLNPTSLTVQQGASGHHHPDHHPPERLHRDGEPLPGGRERQPGPRHHPRPHQRERDRVQPRVPKPDRQRGGQRGHGHLHPPAAGHLGKPHQGGEPEPHGDAPSRLHPLPQPHQPHGPAGG
jgi:hypothetical protein